MRGFKVITKERLEIYFTFYLDEAPVTCRAFQHILPFLWPDWLRTPPRIREPATTSVSKKTYSPLILSSVEGLALLVELFDKTFAHQPVNN